MFDQAPPQILLICRRNVLVCSVDILMSPGSGILSYIDLLVTSITRWLGLALSLHPKSAFLHEQE